MHERMVAGKGPIRLVTAAGMRIRPVEARTMRGFTLIELMFTLALFAILLTIAVPSFMSTMERSRVTTVANDLLAAVQLARTEAIRRNMRVTLCKKASGDQCDNSAGSWSQGWLVFSDPSTQGGVQVDGDSTILSRGNNPPTTLSLSGNIQYVSYVPTGESKQMNGAFLAGTIRVCSTSSLPIDDDRARDIVINSVGRAVIRRPCKVTQDCPGPGDTDQYYPNCPTS